MVHGCAQDEYHRMSYVAHNTQAQDTRCSMSVNLVLVRTFCPPWSQSIVEVLVLVLVSAFLPKKEL